MSDTNRMPTAWVVWVFIVLYAAMLALQAFVKFAMPLDGGTWALLFIVGGYVGMDQFATFVASKKLPQGFKYSGSYKKLLHIVIAMFVLMIVAIVVQAQSPSYELPLDRLAMAAGLVAGLFAGGNKANNAAEKGGSI